MIMKVKNITKSLESKRLAKFLRQDGVIVNFIEMAVTEGTIKIPSLFNDGYAVCVSSVYLGKNCLFFEDEKTKRNFYLVQDTGRAFPWFAYSPSNNIAYLQQDRSTAGYDAFLFKLSKAKPIRGPFKGVLNYYKRPYHYFVDKIAFLFDPRIEGLPLKIVTSKEGAFIDIDNELLPGSSQFTFNDDICLMREIKAGGIYIEPGRSYSKQYNHKVTDRFVEQIHKKSKSLIDVKLSKNYEKYPVLWFGLSAEKRSYVEAEELYKKIIDAMELSFKRYFLIIDGLTSSIGGDKVQLREVSTHELSIVNNLREHLNKGEIVDLIGATAEEKIQHAKYVDFYVANLLTDSIWLSYFNKRQGIGIGAKGVKTLFDNPNMISIDPEQIKNVSNGETNYSKLSFSISPDYLFDIFEEKFLSHYSKAS